MRTGEETYTFGGAIDYMRWNRTTMRRGSDLLMSAGLYLADTYPDMRRPVPYGPMTYFEWRSLREAFNILDACVTLCQATERVG